MSVELEWSEPPVRHVGRTSTKWHDIAEALKARPGEWAKIAEQTASTSHAVRKALSRFGCFEATSRSVGEKRWGIWARYVGEAEQADATVVPLTKPTAVTVPVTATAGKDDAAQRVRAAPWVRRPLGGAS